MYFGCYFFIHHCNYAPAIEISICVRIEAINLISDLSVFCIMYKGLVLCQILVPLIVVKCLKYSYEHSNCLDTLKMACLSSLFVTNLSSQIYFMSSQMCQDKLHLLISKVMMHIYHFKCWIHVKWNLCFFIMGTRAFSMLSVHWITDILS